MHVVYMHICTQRHTHAYTCTYIHTKKLFVLSEIIQTPHTDQEMKQEVLTTLERILMLHVTNQDDVMWCK